MDGQWRVIALEENAAVSIGYFQSLEKEVRLHECEMLGVDVVRRRTGGGAVYHDTRGEITYSVIAPAELFPKDIIESYRVICGWIIDAFALLGLKAEFKPINDIILEGKKVSGNAQTRRNGILLQHGTILYDLDVKKMFTVLNVGPEKIADKFISKDEVYQALVSAFTKDKKWSFGNYSQQEIVQAEDLAKTRYASHDWNFMR